MFLRIKSLAVTIGFGALALGTSSAGCGSNRDGTTNLPDASAFADANGEASLEVCAAQVTTAQRPPVDIIFVIDGSGSMLEETEQVQNNLNAFADYIGKTGLDYQVLMLADKRYKMPFPILGHDYAGICVPPPLGGPDCGDNPPKFRMVGGGPDSTSSLSLILTSYDSSWKQFARINAFKVFIEVTDDESALDYKAFDNAIVQKAPAGMFGDFLHRRYIFDSICGWQEGSAPLAGQKCGTADNPGTQYQHLSILTGGIIDSVCKTSYDAVLGNLAKGLVTSLGCNFGIPQPSSGTVDPAAVIVNYTAGGATSATPLVQVTDASKCVSEPESWYYDDNTKPTVVTFCPALCTKIGGDTSSKLEIALGCKGVPPK